MIDNEFFKGEIQKLAKISFDLEMRGGPNEDGELFEQILNDQSAILKAFELPETDEHTKLLWFEGIPTDLEIEQRIVLLHSAAATYLLSKAKSDLQILQEAQELKQSAFTVLPMLKITTHVYTIFLYDYILMNRIDSVENVLKELRFVNNHDILNSIGKIIGNDLPNSSESINDLSLSNVRYLSHFLFYYSK
jgi:hypothetical protein